MHLSKERGPGRQSHLRPEMALGNQVNGRRVPQQDVARSIGVSVNLMPARGALEGFGTTERGMQDTTLPTSLRCVGLADDLDVARRSLRVVE